MLNMTQAVVLLVHMKQIFHVGFMYLILYWLVVSNIFYFHPYLGKWSSLTNIFQMGWNHQLVYFLPIFWWNVFFHPSNLHLSMKGCMYILIFPKKNMNHGDPKVTSPRRNPHPHLWCWPKVCRKLYQHRPQIAWKGISDFLQFVSSRFTR